MRRGWTSIEVDVDIEVDEYLGYATDEALLEEMSQRGLLSQVNSSNGAESILDILCSKYTLTQSLQVREAITKILNQ